MIIDPSGGAAHDRPGAYYMDTVIGYHGGPARPLRGNEACPSTGVHTVKHGRGRPEAAAPALDRPGPLIMHHVFRRRLGRWARAWLNSRRLKVQRDS